MPLIDTARGAIWCADQRDTSSSAPVLLLIHGAGGSRLDFPAGLRRLPGVEVVVPDLPAHGRSPGAARPQIEAYARDMIALLDALCIHQVIVAGFSMGGAVALALALAFPTRICGVVLIGTGAKLTVHPDILRDVLANPSAAVQRLVDAYWSPQAGAALRSASYTRLIQMPPETLYADLLACNTFDVRERLAEIAVPTLILCGANDTLTPPRYSQFLHERVARSTLAIIPDAAHMVALEQEAAVAAAVRAWLPAPAGSEQGG
jgi:pimeloyl-ACP methyl ester carboxylesterase